MDGNSPSPTASRSASLRTKNTPNPSLSLAADEQLTLMTDGVVEARAANGELFGFDHVQAMATQSAEAIVHAAQAFGQDDDITVMTLRLAHVADNQARAGNT